MTEGGMPNFSSLLMSSEEEMVVGCEGKGAGGAFVERAPSPTTSNIKQSRERTFPYLLCFVSLPCATIVHPKVKTYPLLIKLSLNVRGWRNGRFGTRGVCFRYWRTCYPCLSSIGSAQTKFKLIAFSGVCRCRLNASLCCP